MNATRTERRGGKTLGKRIAENWEIYLLLLPVVAYFIIFAYWPMYGLQIAFKNFKPQLGIWASDWVGLAHFKRFVQGPYFWQLMRNTFFISLYSLVAGFPFPIILAIFLNYQRGRTFKRIVQTVSYAPHFISVVVIVGMLQLFTSPYSGLVNKAIELLGGTAVNFMASKEWFPHIYVWSGIWQHTGWSAIIYIGALTSISPELHEAAVVDGASALQRIWHVDLPGIAQTIIILLILDCGSLFSVGFEKIFLMQNNLNSSVSEVISTYVYKQGIIGAQYSYSSAVGLFNNLVSFICIVVVNQIAKKVSSVSLF